MGDKEDGEQEENEEQEKDKGYEEGGGLEERRERETRTLTGSEFEKRSGREKERA